MAGDLTRDDVERYLRVNRRGKGMFAVIAGVGLALGLMVAAATDDHRSSSQRRRQRGAGGGFVLFGGVGGFVGLGVAVIVDNLRRRAQLQGLSGDQIRRLDEALIANADVDADVDLALVERTWNRANQS